MSKEPLLKLPGWVQRPPDLTPPLRFDGAWDNSVGPDLGTLEDPANDVTATAQRRTQEVSKDYG